MPFWLVGPAGQGCPRNRVREAQGTNLGDGAAQAQYNRKNVASAVQKTPATWPLPKLVWDIVLSSLLACTERVVLKTRLKWTRMCCWYWSTVARRISAINDGRTSSVESTWSNWSAIVGNTDPYNSFCTTSIHPHTSRRHHQNHNLSQCCHSTTELQTHCSRHRQNC